MDLVGTNILPPDLKLLTGLKSLKTLNLPGPMWNPGASARIDYSRDLSHIAGIASLEELIFSDTYLDFIKFDDKGLEAIAALAPGLRVLSLANTQVRGHRLGAFKNLEALDLVYCPVDDQGLNAMQGMTRLRKLLVRDAVISDESLRSLRALANLEQLDLGGTRIADAGIAHLSGLNKLKKLNLQGAALTDQGIRELAAMTDLEELNLYGTRVTNAGVDVLCRLKHLSTVDLRYTRVTRAGVDRLRASVPRCHITFLDSSVRPTLPRGADKIVASEGDTAVAAWVRSMGGHAVVDNGGLIAVSLAVTSVTDELLPNLKALMRLRKLELQSTEIGDPGVRHLAKLTSLSQLDLSGTTISDLGLAHLAGLTGLRELRLAHTQITGAGLKHLQSLPIEKLQLSSSPTTDEGVAQLAAIVSLRDLNLAFTDVTDGGLAPLESLPSLDRLDLAGD